jgi:short-subunit dehydrogenase
MRALITGAAGGLGTAFAYALAARGEELLLVDRDAAALADAAQAVARTHGVPVETREVDLADRAAAAALGDEAACAGDIGTLVNNAGFMMGGSFTEHDPDRLVTMMDVHVGASVALCHAVAPAMIARRQGVIINLGSLGGFEPGAADIVYGATKQFLIHFSLALSGQVRAAGVRVQALCPGLTRTRFHDGTADGEAVRGWFPRQFWMAPEAVVAASLAALDDSEVICIPGAKNRVLRRLMRHPRLLGMLISAARRV